MAIREQSPPEHIREQRLGLPSRAALGLDVGNGDDYLRLFLDARIDDALQHAMRGIWPRFPVHEQSRGSLQILKSREINIWSPPNEYNRLLANPGYPPEAWRDDPFTGASRMHGIAPYIGRLKATIARDLVATYSRPGDLIVDPFSGSGTIPLEALLQGRSVLAFDPNPYAAVLTRAKLFHPESETQAVEHAEYTWENAMRLPIPDLRSVPGFVRAFFHPRTLKDAVRLADASATRSRAFTMSCLLGILHHQRPGFLSYPSSHLIPYLRDRKYPRSKFLEMYEYREVWPRLEAKIRRAYRHATTRPRGQGATFRQLPIARSRFPDSVDAIITSPPYMNELDYERDNRLRIWFLRRNREPISDESTHTQRAAFPRLIRSLAIRAQRHLRKRGHCVLIIGERVRRKTASHPSRVIAAIMARHAPSLRLESILSDRVPDVSHRHGSAPPKKLEHFLVYTKL